MTWDSSSTLGDSSRWDSEELPAFPLPFCTVVSPKLPQRQRTLEKQEMIELMIMGDSVAGIPLEQDNALVPVHANEQAEQRSASTPLNHDMEEEADQDCPRQHMAPPRLPRRQGSPRTMGRSTSRMARMINHAQRRRPTRVTTVSETNETRTPERANGFYEFKRAQTL